MSDNLTGTVKELETDIRIIHTKVDATNAKVDDIRRVVDRQTQLLEQFMIYQERHSQLVRDVEKLDKDFKNWKETNERNIEDAKNRLTTIKAWFAALAFVVTISSGWISWIVKRQVETIDNLNKTQIILLERQATIQTNIKDLQRQDKSTD